MTTTNERRKKIKARHVEKMLRAAIETNRREFGLTIRRLKKKVAALSEESAARYELILEQQTENQRLHEMLARWRDAVAKVRARPVSQEARWVCDEIKRLATEKEA